MKVVLWWCVLAWVAACGATFHAAAQAAVLPPIELSGNTPLISLDGRSRYWSDAGAQRTPDEIEAAGESLPWAIRDAGRQYRLDGQALWIEFAVAARGPGRWFLQLASSGVDRAQLFHRTVSGAWSVQEAGDSKPVSQWSMPGRVPAFELAPRADGEPLRYWLRVEHRRVDFGAPIAIYTQAALTASREGEQFLLGAYFGLAALITLVAAANAFVFRDRNFAAYAVYVLTITAGQVAYLGVGAQHLWDDWLRWNELATFILPSLGAAAALWFVQGITEPARFSHALNTGVWLLIGAVLLAVGADTLLASRTSFRVVMFTILASMVMVMLLIGLVWTQGDDPDMRLIALGFLPVLVMAAFPLARSLNLTPNSSWTRYGVAIGAALEMPILFYALSLRVSRRRESKVRAAALGRSDALTGLADARTLAQRLDAALERAASQKHACALLAVNIANFDALVLEYGRDTGERALVVAASHLRNAVTDIDLAARVGDHGFALLLEGPTTAEMAASRSQQVVASGLRHSDALPPGVVLKFHVTAAVLPDRHFDAAASLRWLVDAVNGMRPEARKQIRPLNF